MKVFILALTLCGLCTACQSVPRVASERDASSQSGVSVYGVVDAAVIVR